MIEILDPGRHTSVQDAGRPGYERFGIPPGGVADWFSAAVANRLVGNDPAAALFEAAGAGPTIRFLIPATIAVAGASVLPMTGLSAPTFSWTSRVMPGGSLLNLGPIGPGLRSYVAVRGGLDVASVLGSRSLCASGAFGGGFGRSVNKNDRIDVGTMVRDEAVATSWPEGHRLPLKGPWEVRVIAGPHTDAFPADALTRLEATACLITPAVDRMGLRIATPGLHLRGDEILTTPMTAGALQVTPSGQLIALLVDHPTTGGYPVIATVITADIPLLAQARPGETIRFRQVDRPTAASALRRLTDWLDDL